MSESADLPAIRAGTGKAGSIWNERNDMDVLALTIFVSSCLVGIFIFCFAGEFRRSRNSSPERDSLLPLDDDAPLSK